MSAGIAPFNGDDGESERLVPISALQHAVYCLRQAALIHVEQQWTENRFTAEGKVLHESVDSGRGRTVGNVRRVHGLSVGSIRLGLVGKCDLVEVGRAEITAHAPITSIFPVEFKRGKAKAHRADEVQLCAQAMCLEDMTGLVVREGALFYGQTRRRVSVTLDSSLRMLTASTIRETRAVFLSGHTPPPTRHVSRCKRCSLRDDCRPGAVRRRSASDWVASQLETLLSREEVEQ